MKARYAFAALALGLTAAPALADDEYYLVQDTATKKCTVVEKKPTVSTMVVVGNGTVYKSRTDADAAMTKETVCTTTR